MNARLDRKKLRTYALGQRQSKVHVSRFGKPHHVGDSVASFLENLPAFLGAEDLKTVARSIVEARADGKVVLLAMGAHVIKVGLSPLVINLLQEGWVSALATNGAGMVHDFEIAMVGHTSENVDASLEAGSFGMARETGSVLNDMIREVMSREEGLGQAVGRGLLERNAPFSGLSLLVGSVQNGHPMTVHVAIGTDVHHLHPSADGAALGTGSYRDFLIFCERVASLEKGVYINLGSAVLLPEIFLKAVSLARNLGSSLQEITTVNMDLIQHYRPLTNVIRRPTTLGGHGYALTGHHEILVPLLSAAIKEEAVRQNLKPADRLTP